MVSKIKDFIFKLLVFCFFAVVVPHQIQVYALSAPTGHINDYAAIISDDIEQELEKELAAIAQASNGAEIAVLTITSLEGDTIENVAQDVFDSWKIGKKQSDNGLLLLVAVDDRQVRIQTGYGTEAVITDGIAGRIIRNQITPAFKEGDYNTGIKNGLETIISYLNDPSKIPQDEAATSISSVWDSLGIVFWIFLFLTFGIGFISYVAAFLGRSKAWWPGGLVGGTLGLLVGSIIGGIIFGLLGLLFDYILSKNYKQWKKQKRSSNWSFRSSRSSGSSSGGFGGFSGGSSGGGGASSSW